MAEFWEAKTTKGGFVKSLYGGYWLEDGKGDKSDRERYDIWSWWNVLYEDRVHQRRVIATE